MESLVFYHVLAQQLFGFRNVQVCTVCTGLYNVVQLAFISYKDKLLLQGVAGFELDWDLVFPENPSEFLPDSGRGWFLSV